MMLSRPLSILAISLIALALSAASSAPAQANETPTLAYLNGTATAVFFNDGDSFRVLAGPMKGTKARLKGFNTLESYGPVHAWGGWTAKEMSRWAKLGTMNARKGIWNCESKDMKKDGYGRILWDCRDLAIDQIRKGLAHAMTVTKDPAEPDLLEAQAAAIRDRVGIWAHGVPDFVLTSLHSLDEGRGDKTYNRTVSSRDGHSKKWYHQQTLVECQSACTPSIPDEAAVKRLAQAIKGNEAHQAITAMYVYEGALEAAITGFVAIGFLEPIPDESLRVTFESILLNVVKRGELSQGGAPVACMTHVDFKRRFGATKAKCLK